MVYIYKKIIGGKPYYYLRASISRKGKHVTKDIAYLGNSVKDIEKSIKNLKDYKKEIRKAYKSIQDFIDKHRFLEKAKSMKPKKDNFLGPKLEEVNACRLHFLKNFQKLDNITKKEIWRIFIVAFAHNTTSIEGNTITLKEAETLLEEGKTPKNKSLREIYDLKNTEKVFFNLLDSKKEIDHEFIINIHRELMENIDKRIGYRSVPGRDEVRVAKSTFDATPAKFVKTDMHLLLNWYSKYKNKLHPLVLASLFHHKFEKIHPFMNGNGRTGRMILNYILLKNNFPPLVVYNDVYSEYKANLTIADKSPPKGIEKKYYFELVQFMADQIIRSYWNIFL
jgi:fido (protein-threonine AMPylation protein)